MSFVLTCMARMCTTTPPAPPPSPTSLLPTPHVDAERVARHMRSYMKALGVPANKREDVRSWAQAQEGFFDMTIEDQERFIQKTASLALLGQK